MVHFIHLHIFNMSYKLTIKRSKRIFDQYSCHSSYDDKKSYSRKSSDIKLQKARDFKIMNQNCYPPSF
jgi:hypothetical protein